jgi:HAD superfamily phosphatase (TIGR01668 family)
METSRKAALVINTVSRRGRELVSDAVRLLKEAGVEVESHPITNPKNLRSQVRDLVTKGFNPILVGGGDGTISEIVDELVYKDVVLGVLPLGTANSFTKSLDIPADLPGAIQAIVHGRVVEVDLGKVNNTYFANAVSIGFASNVASDLADDLKKRYGVIAYAIQGLRNIRKTLPFTATLKGKKTKETFETYQMVLANGGFYGPAQLIPKKRLQSNDLTIFTFSNRGPLHILWMWIRSIFGSRFSVEDVPRVRIEEEINLTTTPPQHVSIDGEIKMDTPITIGIAPKALKVLVAPESKLQQSHPLQPDERHDSIRDIDFSALGRRHIIVDVDNTLVTTSGTVVDEATVNFLKSQRDAGYIEALCLVTNNSLPQKGRKQRIKGIAEQLNASYVFAQGWFSKPHPKPFKQAMAYMKSKPETTAVIGDQIYTDIRGGKRLGLYTILVKPMGKDYWFTFYRRWKERRLHQHSST